jgi:NADPH:quinone reductase
VLSWEEVQLGKPGPGEARIRHTAVGLNFIDVYNRMGLYPQPMPSGLGGEGAGVVEDIGTGVTEVKPGDGVAYTGGPLDAYSDSEARLIPAERHCCRRGQTHKLMTRACANGCGLSA